MEVNNLLTMWSNGTLCTRMRAI